MRSIALIALLLLPASSALAAEVKISAATFESPGGVAWTESRQGDTATYTYKVTENDKTRAAFIEVRSTPNYHGDFNADFEAMPKGIDAIKDTKPLTEGRGTATNGWPMRTTLICCGAGDMWLRYEAVGFRTPDSMVTVQLAMIDMDGDTEKKIEAAFSDLVASIDFAGYGKRPAMPTPLPSETPLNGLYTHSEGQSRVNGIGGLDYVVITTNYFFQPSGLFADQPPSGTDLAAFCEARPEACGVYRVSGGMISMLKVGEKYGLVTSDSETLAPDGANLTIDGNTYFNIPPIESMTLDGTWTYFYAATGSIGGTSTAISTVHTLIFQPDGHFKRSGFVGASSTIESGGTVTGTTSSADKPEQTGTYAIKDYTLTLTVDGAEKAEQLSFFLPDAKDQDLLMIDGDAYLREGRDQ